SPLGCSATDGWACICRWASWEFVGLPGLAPSACCAAVGWPCIWRCVSCDEVATSPLARFIVSVGGCCLASVAIPVVWLLLCDAGPEPASLSVRPVSHGPAHAVPAPRTMTEQPARISRFMFMRVSSFLLSRAPTEQEIKEPSPWDMVPGGSVSDLSEEPEADACSTLGRRATERHQWPKRQGLL